MPPALRVLVADDQAPFRNAARAVLEIAQEFEVVGEVTSGEEAVDAAVTLRPDLVVMDVKMDGIGGIEATRRILASRPQTVVVLVSSYRSEDVPERCRRVRSAGLCPEGPVQRVSAQGSPVGPGGNPSSDKYASTALTRRLMSDCHVSPSFRKIEWITFSTECSVMTSARAIAAFDFPCAISSSV